MFLSQKFMLRYRSFCVMAFLSLLFVICNTGNAFASGQQKIFKESIEVNTFESRYREVIDVGYEYTAFAIGGYQGVDIVAKVDGSFQKIASNIDTDGQAMSELIFLEDPASELEIVVENIDGSAKDLDFYFFDTRVDQALEEADLVAASSGVKQVKVISRKGWGADESLRYTEEKPKSALNGSIEGTGSADCDAIIDKYPSEFKYNKVIDKDKKSGEYLYWPQQYSKDIKKIFVHHTADSDKKGRTNKEIIRAIYYYHTVSRGWGDVGYNYLIDDKGNIYEGRAGGDYVVGAHAFCNNIGTVGIALVGNYQDQAPPKKQVDSLVKLSSILSKKYDVDPIGKTRFHGENKPNILGHRDVKATACPGENLYNKMSFIRKSVLVSGGYELIDDGEVDVKDYAAQLVSSVKEIKMKPSETKKVTLKFKNTGKETWTENNWLFVFGNIQEDIRVQPVLIDKEYVAADMKEKTVRPGGTATFEVEITAGYKEGFYTFEFTPVANSRFKINGASVVQPITVSKPKISYSIVKKPEVPQTLFTGQSFEMTLKLKNTGNVSWFGENGKLPNNAMSIGTERPRDRKSLFKEENRTRLAFLREDEVKPGKTGTFVFKLKAPTKVGILREFYSPVINNVQWLTGKNLSFSTKVVKPSFVYRYASLAQKKITMARGREKLIEFELINLGNFPWMQDQITFQIAKTKMPLHKTSGSVA